MPIFSQATTNEILKPEKWVTSLYICQIFKQHGAAALATTATFDDIVKYLRSAGLDFGIGSRNTIAMKLKGAGGTYRIIVQYKWEKELIVLYVEYPFHAPKEHMADICELAARVNWGLLFAAAEVNPDTGLIRFRSTMLTDDAPFIASQFGSMFSTACSIAERYAQAFKGVADGRLSVGTAIHNAESGTTPFDTDSSGNSV